jgi:hypothetical protein
MIPDNLKAITDEELLLLSRSGISSAVKAGAHRAIV